MFRKELETFSAGVGWDKNQDDKIQKLELGNITGRGATCGFGDYGIKDMLVKYKL